VAVPLAQARAAGRHGGRALFRSTVRKMAQSRAIAFDDQEKDYLDNLEMKRVLLEIRKLLKRKIDIKRLKRLAETTAAPQVDRLFT
jgi:hypothetical protein